MAEVKPLKLRQEKVQATRIQAVANPYAKVLVDHQILHLGPTFDYLVPEEFTDSAIPGALVEVEIGHLLCKGLILERSNQSSTHGGLKQLIKVLSIVPYVLPGQLTLLQEAASMYGASPWDLIRSSVPPFSKVGERRFQESSGGAVTSDPKIANSYLTPSLVAKLRSPETLICAIETPLSTPYWKIIAAISIQRAVVGDVMVLTPNERELELLAQELVSQGVTPLVISGSMGKSDRYFNYLQVREPQRKIVIATRSCALMPLMGNATIVVQDDVDESHYERGSPTWNTRDLVQLREENQSVIFVSSTISLEIANRITQGSLPLFKFPEAARVKVHSRTQDSSDDYFPIIQEGLKRGSVLLSIGATGYVTSFSCQKCRNIALCGCGGKLYFPARATNPMCATCGTVVIGWRCSWCQESKPRILRSGVLRKAEEFGRAFPNQSVISSSAANPTLLLPEGRHLVLSTPGVEPRGIYAAEIFLDLEGRLLRTTLRATEELRLHLLRTLSMLAPGGDMYLALPASDAFLQSVLRRNTLNTAQREILERDVVSMPPNIFSAVVSGEDVEAATKIINAVNGLEIVGPFLRLGKKTILIKAPRVETTKIVQLLLQINKVQSMRKATLLTYRLDPYSLN